MSAILDDSTVIVPAGLAGSQQPDLKTDAPVQDQSRRFEIVSEFAPAGDQPTAIAELTAGIQNNESDQVLLGVTGSGKTFTVAHIIQDVQRPALILAPNKTLAAQLYGEMKSFFPNNAVEYFVSYYDYYQPEAYVPRTDTYVEKEASINEQIDRMRHSATRSLLERDDVIIVASVSCIYGIGSVETYGRMIIKLSVGERIDLQDLTRNLVELQYKRNDVSFHRGTFRRRGDSLEIFPAHLEDRAWRLSFFGDELEAVQEFDPLTGERTADLESIRVFANSHYVTPKPTLRQAVKGIKDELKIRLEELYRDNKLLEAQRLEQRTSQIKFPPSSAVIGVHLASYQSAEDARKGWKLLRAKYNIALGGLVPHYVDVDTVSGPFIRLMVGLGFPRSDLNKIITAVRAGGDYCMVMPLPYGAIVKSSAPTS